MLSANGDVKRITSTSIESDYKALVAAKLIPAVFFDRKQKTSESNDAKKFNILNEGNVIIDTDFKPAFTESLAIKTHKPFETPMVIFYSHF